MVAGYLQATWATGRLSADSVWAKMVARAMGCSPTAITQIELAEYPSCGDAPGEFPQSLRMRTVVLPVRASPLGVAASIPGLGKRQTPNHKRQKNLHEVRWFLEFGPLEFGVSATTLDQAIRPAVKDKFLGTDSR